MLADKLRALNKDKQPNILVIGDLMLDRYVWGTATRLSPEAPVPIVNVSKETATPGGAANVAQNLLSLGALVTLAGITGDDTAADELLDILNAEKLNTDHIVRDSTRPTTVKTRYLSGNHQMLRVDRETSAPVNAEIEAKLVNDLQQLITKADIVLLSDYNKGLFTPTLTQKLITFANTHHKKVIIDPKGLDHLKYKGAFIIKPNRKELAEAAKTTAVHNIATLQTAANLILAETAAQYLVVTLSEEGMVILNKDGYKMLPVTATEVFDVTGAGDTVLATIAYFLSTGLDVEEACELANYAAAIVIKHVGNATTTVEEILKELPRN